MLGYASAGKAASPHPAGPAWARNLPIYETALELSTPNGKFHEFEQRLDALKDLGVGIIWFLPIFPRGGNPPDKPASNSAYCVRDYYDVNPAHGTKEEFKHLVAAANFLRQPCHGDAARQVVERGEFTRQMPVYEDQQTRLPRDPPLSQVAWR